MALCVVLAGCRGARPTPVGERLNRMGDEIVACGQLFHTGTPVVLWTDPGGYDAYRVERRFAPFDAASWEKTAEENKNLKTPNRYGLRTDRLTPEQIERCRGGGWDLATLQQAVELFVLHYDVCGTSRQCFNVLHDKRGLSVHFLLDLDGTIYQTLDLKERAWHATVANSRSVGIEIANVGAYGEKEKDPFADWYATADGRTRITIPTRFGDGGIRTPDFLARPARSELVRGTIQGRDLRQYDFTPQQYDALVKLTAALCTVFPKLRCDYPRDESGQLITRKLPDDQFAAYHGLLGHYHVQTDKVDPGPAFQWDKVIEGARKLLDQPQRR
jgi:N-acetyl-anhydromuramyl-L-alanine amidase AmpD